VAISVVILQPALRPLKGIKQKVKEKSVKKLLSTGNLKTRPKGSPGNGR